MISIKNFTATDKEFIELARIDNLVNHDSIAHPDEDKNEWNIRDKSIIRDRLLLYIEDILVGVMYYSQGRDENNKTTFFTLNLDPKYNNNGYRKLLYNKMLETMKENLEIVKNAIKSKEKKILIVEKSHHNLFDKNPDQTIIFKEVLSFIKG